MLKNTQTSYGWLAKSFHWVMALLIISMLALGLYMQGLSLSPDKIKLYGLHKSFGALVLILVTLRLAWRQINTIPKLPAQMPEFEKLGAHLSHYGLYAAMFLMPLTGWAMSSSAGFPVSFFGLFELPNFVAANEENRKLFATIHEYMAYGLIALITLHALAALKHHFIEKDDIMKRMLPAFLVISLFCGNASAAQKWNMVSAMSKIEFTATQNNSPVTGKFNKFSADIDFDKDDLPNSHIKITVDMASVTASYAEVSATLQTPEWFSSAIFPQGIYESKTIRDNGNGNYIAEGTLTIRDKIVPVNLEFTFANYSGTEATATGKAHLSRNAFGIGQGDWQKTDVVKDEVELNFILQAATN